MTCTSFASACEVAAILCYPCNHLQSLAARWFASAYKSEERLSHCKAFSYLVNRHALCIKKDFGANSYVVAFEDIGMCLGPFGYFPHNLSLVQPLFTGGRGLGNGRNHESFARSRPQSPCDACVQRQALSSQIQCPRNREYVCGFSNGRRTMCFDPSQSAVVRRASSS